MPLLSSVCGSLTDCFLSRYRNLSLFFWGFFWVEQKIKHTLCLTSVYTVVEFALCVTVGDGAAVKA